MQAVLSHVHRIVVAPSESAARSHVTSISPDTSSSSSVPASPSPPSQNPQLACSVAMLDKFRAESERLQFATLLPERKKAVSALQVLVPPSSMVHKSKMDITIEEQELRDAAVPAVLAALVSDPRDTELMEMLLEFLQLLVTRVPSAALLLLDQPLEDAGAIWGMPTCLTLLQDPSPWIRGPAVALVKGLQEADPSAFAKSVLECKEGLRRLLEVVGDRREHIRDTALSVLGQLTAQDKNAQQFLAFEEGFSRFFQILEAEGLMETGTSLASGVFADCLHIVNNIVKDNLMTQTLLLEMPYLESHVSRILSVSGLDGRDENEDVVARERRKHVLKLGLQLVRCLVTGLYEGVKASSLDEMAQRDRARKSLELARIQSLVARQEALMGAVGELVCCRSDALTDVRLQALDLLRLVSEHNGGAQMILVNLYASPSGRNVLAELVRLDVGVESAESPVAVAASALLDVLFQENEGACMAVLQHIHTPPPPPISAGGEDVGSGYVVSSVPFSAGRILLDAFVVNTNFITQCSKSNDTETLNSKLVMAWKASHRLTSLLANSSYCKELALRVPAEYEDSQTRAVAGGLFLSRSIRMLRTTSDEDLGPTAQSIIFQAKLSVLLLLIRWCHDCPKAVREITGSVTSLSVLVDTLSAQQTSTSSRSVAETTQLRGLIALLLGCCLEFLCEDEEEQALKIARTAVSAEVHEEKSGLEMTRDQLLQLISKRVGLERFTDALVQFQQTPAVLVCAQASLTQSSRTLLAYRAAYDITGTDTVAEGHPNDDDEAHYLFMLYERTFTIFYREMAEQIQKRVITIYAGVDGMSGGVDSGTPNDMGPYQDLIRMQDKQICNLQRQVEKLKQCVMDQGSQDNETLSTNPSTDKALIEQLAAQREQFEREKADMEDKLTSMSKSALEMETRMNGLAMAYEQLEAEHQEREQELAVIHSGAKVVQSSSVPLSSLQLQLATLHAELDAEREASRRLLSEVDDSKGAAATHVRREKDEAELACTRLMKQLEERRVENDRKDKELAECKQMLETLTEGEARVKSDNERLKAQLAETLSRPGQIDEAEYRSIVDAKARLEDRVEELEAAAHTAYEKDQEVLRQRIEEVEQARALLNNDVLSIEATSTEKSWEVDTEDHRLNELVSTQLGELKELRALVVEMDSVAKEREAQVKQASFLQDLVAGYDIQSQRDKEMYDASVRKVEDELARVFLEKKDIERKAKTAVKELENEVARLFLAKVELEKKLGPHHPDDGTNQVENGKPFSANGSSRDPAEFENSNDPILEDLLVLVASLEIQCCVLRESLREARGEDAVAVAVELSRQRGAIVSV